MKQYRIELPEEVAIFYEQMAKRENRDIQQVLVEWLKTIAKILGR